MPYSTLLYQLQSLDSVPVIHFQGREAWPADRYVVPQLSVGADATNLELEISAEHTKIQWLDYGRAIARLEYQSNATALWELNERLRRSDLLRPAR